MGVERTDGVRRRRTLSALVALAGLTATSGCASVRDALWSQPGATDVVVFNAGETSKTVTVTITDSEADEPHTARTVTLTPGEEIDPVNRSKLPLTTDYAVDVVVEDGPSETFDWDDPTVERAPLWVRVDDSRNIEFLLQAG